MFAVSTRHTAAGMKRGAVKTPDAPWRSIEEIRAEKLAEQRARQQEEMRLRADERAMSIVAAYRMIHVTRPRTIAATIERIAKETGVSAAEIIGQRRSRHIVEARFKAIAAASDEFPDKSMVQIARAFNRDHTTILSALRHMKAWPRKPIEPISPLEDA